MGSFETITIQRDYPVINGYVQVPPNLEYQRNLLPITDAASLFPGSELVLLPGQLSGEQAMLRSAPVALDKPHAGHFLLNAPATATVGGVMLFIVTAETRQNTVDTEYAGTVHFSSSDGLAVLPGDATLRSGQGIFSVTLNTIGNQILTATDSVMSDITGAATISVSAGILPTSHFGVTAPSLITAGSSLVCTVVAEDRLNNTTAGFTGSVTFSSTDSSATLPPASSLTSGAGTFSATLTTAGSRTITVTQATMTGTSGPIVVSAKTASHLVVSAPTTIKAGNDLQFTVVAKDQFNNTATAFTGTVTFSGGGLGVVLPVNSSLVSGVGIFSATLTALGTTTLTATDTVTSSITGKSGGIAVAASTKGLVVTNKGSNTVSVLLANGDGTFQGQTTYATGVGPKGLVLADLNNDSNQELVVASFLSGLVSVLLGNGDGTFQTNVDFASLTNPVNVDIADFDKNGNVDVVATGTANGGFPEVFLGNGDGTFQLRNPIFLTATQGLAAGNIDSDTNPDFIAASAGSLKAFLGNGDGTFQTAQTFAVGAGPNSTAILKDINGDHQLDAVCCNKGGATVSALLGNGNGTFQARTDFAVGTSPYAVAVADVNGDGVQDLVVTNSGSNTISVLLGNNNGTFQSQQTFGTGTTPYGVTVADLNGDGKQDIAVANEGTTTVSVLLGNGDGSFQEKTDFAVGSNPWRLRYGIF